MRLKGHTERLHSIHFSYRSGLLFISIQWKAKDQQVEWKQQQQNRQHAKFRLYCIAPHSLVFTPQRWHVRAYCEKNRDFRDFVLSRFRGFYGVEGKAEQRQQDDSRWITLVPIELIPDTRLTQYQKAIIETDYNMHQGKCLLTPVQSRPLMLVHWFG